MKFRTALIATILAASATFGGARAASSDDSSFVVKAQQDVLGQYALAALARGKAGDANAKALANAVASNADHANIWLKKYAKAHNVQLEDKPSMRASAQYGELQSSKGSSFDKYFARDINVDAQMQLGRFQDAASSASDPALKTFAKQQAAKLEQFSAQAQKMPH
ncbi:MAG TPA: DUF4142 domain-containing protein [Candidatus Aquilonibacter sp.]|nr:DUF4142 domain-containing protein [Candidatus Aquilonibacter sp.]